ncbi:MAG: beta-N-acetylhexosaminidase [Carboxylicivirga sp.]|jgi:hexosaminidase|nr:beta-N-acetylhexosaminidase [Carboxylicivirga sp.]
MKIRVLLFFCIGFIGMNASGVELKLIPQPNSMQISEENVVLANEILIDFNTNTESRYLEESLRKTVLKHLDGEKSGSRSDNELQKIVCSIDKRLPKEEAYKIEIDEKAIRLTGASGRGLFYAIQTLDQIFTSYLDLRINRRINKLSIVDAPRFEYRALMLDPARHMLPVEDIKRYVDAMAYYKFNTLHLHLTDDHGWRLEMKEYPRLTELGAKRDATFNDEILKGGFYTAEDLKGLVAYAAQRNVKVIPEVDIPGHGHALLTAYPEFACFPDTTLKAEINEAYPHAAPICIGNHKFYAFYEDVIRELSEIFTADEIHIGGDEVNEDAWSKCPKCQNLKNEKGLAKDDQLMDYLFERVTKIASEYGKNVQFWHEAGHKYPAGETIFLWRLGTAHSVIEDARKQKLKLICAPGEYAYFDYPESQSDKDYLPAWIPILPLKKVYEFDPAYGLPKEESESIRGIEATIWGESVKNIHRAFYMTFPRAFALADAGWTDMENREWKHFVVRMQHHLNVLLERGVNYRPPVELYKSKN